MLKTNIGTLAALSLSLSPLIAHAVEPLTLDALAPQHRDQVTCMMLAGVAVSEFERGVRKDAYGLGQGDLERLGEGLAALLEAEYGADSDTTRALISAEFEQSSQRVMQLAEEDPDAPEEFFDEQADSCRPYWDAGALPPPPSYHDKPVDAYFCFALESNFAAALASDGEQDSAASMAFARRANRIEAALLEEAGEDEEARQEVGDALMSLAASFDVAAWDALPEEEAEAIMTWCDQLAGPDE